MLLRTYKRGIKRIRYIDCWTRKERSETICPKAGIWKLRSIYRGFEIWRRPLILGGEEGQNCIIGTFRKEMFKRVVCVQWEACDCEKERSVQEDIKLYERNGDKKYRKVAITIKCKWDNKVGKMQRLLEATEEWNGKLRELLDNLHRKSNQRWSSVTKFYFIFI
jgi:hypothetical protein